MRYWRIAIGLLIAVAPGAAAADGSKVVVVPLTTADGGDGGEIGTRLTEEVVAMKQAAGADAEMSRAQRADIMMLSGCDDERESCLASVASTLAVDEVIFGEVVVSTTSSVVTLHIARDSSAVVHKTYKLIGTAPEALATQLRAVAGGDMGIRQPPSTAATEPEPVAPPTGTTAGAPELGPTAGGAQNIGSDRRSKFNSANVRPTSWATGAAGVGMLVVGGVLFTSAASKQDEIDDAPTETLEDFRRLEQLESQGDTLNAAATTTVILGAALVGVGVFLIVRDGSREPVEPSVSIAPTAGEAGLGASVVYWGAF